VKSVAGRKDLNGKMCKSENMRRRQKQMRKVAWTGPKKTMNFRVTGKRM